MDGFDFSLKSSLRKTSGDLVFYKSNGFFKVNNNIKQAIEFAGVKEFSALIQTEGFLINDGQHLGVLAMGIESASYSQVTSLRLNVKKNEIVIGSELAKELGLRAGDEVVLALANGNQGFSSLPLLERFMVGQVYHHGIYYKDSRFVYIEREHLKKILGFDDRVNVVTGLIEKNKEVVTDSFLTDIESAAGVLQSELGPGFFVRPFWSEFSTLIKAVKVQKLSISLILQIIVIISIFNILAFVIFLNEKKSKTIFLICSLGISKKRMVAIWMSLILGIWLASCFFSIMLAQALDWILQNVPLFDLPAQVYNLSKLKLRISLAQYGWVFSGALLWVLLINLFGLGRLKSKSLVGELRKEFS